MHFVVLTEINAQQKKNPFYQTSISAGPVLSFYKVNKNYTSNKKSGAAFTANIKANFRINRTASINLGLQYLIHGNSFSSYYFADSTLHLYDKNFNYDYINKFQDVSLPIGLKIKLNSKKQKQSCIYTEINWALKKRFQSNMQVNSSLYGYSVYDDIAGNDFKSRFFPKKMGSTIALSLGFDKTFSEKKSGYFIALSYMYTLNTFYYVRANNLPKDLYQVESFLSISAGIRF